MTLTRNKIEICLLGCGQWGKLILRDLINLGCDVTVVDPDKDAQSLALDTGASTVASNCSNLPPTIKGFIVATPASSHFDTICSTLSYQKPIFVEKPLTTDSHSARQLTRLAGDRIFVMEKWRYHPAVRAMADMVNSAEFGQLQTIRCKRVQWGQSQHDVSPIWTLMPHDISIVHHILGQFPQPVHAYVEYSQDGQPLSISARLQAAGTAVFIDVSSLELKKERKLTLVFEKAVIVMDNPMADHILLQHRNNKGDLQISKIAIKPSMPLYDELKDFIGYLSGDSHDMPGLEVATHSVELIEACLSSANRAT